MNKLTATFTLLLSAVTLSVAVAQERLVIVSEFGLSPLAEYATQYAQIDNVDVHIASGAFPYCTYSNPNVVLLTSLNFHGAELG